MIFEILISIIIAFLGYSIGRIGHIVGGGFNAPHHWIYGLIIMLIGLFVSNSFAAVIFLAFGLGLVISDLKDFLELRFYGPDNVNEKWFWGID